MKCLRHLCLLALVVVIIVRPGNGCSPGDPEAIFVQRYGPDAPYKTYAAGRLGVLLPTYRPRHLVIAYDYFNGRPLTPKEQSQAGAAEQAINYTSGEFDAATGQQGSLPGLRQWLAIHQTTVPEPANAISTDSKIPGQQYESYANCLDDAFLTAAKTLASRQQSYGKSSPEILDWLHAQDAVFSNCGGGISSTPQPAPANTPLWLRQDRDYQIASANFYAAHFKDARTGFRSIAADQASPWHTIAPYLVARTLIRQATVVPEPCLDNSETVTAEQKRVHDCLGAALQQLDAVLHDPALKSIHPAAANLRDLVAARVEPEAQARALAQRLTAAPHGLDFRQNLIDLTYILNSRPAPPTKGSASVKVDPTGLLSFLQVISTPTEPPQPSFYETFKPESPAEIRSRLAAQEVAARTAYTQWESTKKLAWLVASLTLAQPGAPFSADLIAEARSLPTNSPAYATATYNRLRLEAALPATRVELASILPSIEKTESRSTVNLFGNLLNRTAPTLADFLQSVPRLPSGTNFDGAINSSLDIPTPQLCGPKLDPAHTPLFDSDAATIFNQRLPLRLLREAALSETLPPNLRYQIAIAALTRAVLLDDPATVASVGPFLADCQPALKPWLDRYNNAAVSGSDPALRHLQGLFLLMRFPSAEPLVHSGNQRSSGFAGYSALRDNWWSGNTQYIETEPSAKGSTPPGPANPNNYVAVGPTLRTVFPEDSYFTPALFSFPIIPPNTVPSPPFLTSSEASQAAHEIFALQHIRGASDYFAIEALAWVKSHPADPDNADLLGFAIRVVRNAPRADETRELNHQLFDTLHRKYPASEWAKRYTTWE